MLLQQATITQQRMTATCLPKLDLRTGFQCFARITIDPYLVYYYKQTIYKPLIQL